MKGQERLHFKSERDSRRREICSALVTLDAPVYIYHAATLTPKQGRPRCLEMLVADLAELSATRLVLEQDDSTMKADRRVLYDAVGKHGFRDQLSYHHLRFRTGPLLWIPDVHAWACGAAAAFGRRSRTAYRGEALRDEEGPSGSERPLG